MTTKPKRRIKKPYWWFQGASVRELYSRLTEHGPDGARLEVRLEGQQLTFRVVPAAEAAAAVAVPKPADINDSHRCPPFCP